MTESMFEHSLAALLLVARAGDIGSTYLATPRLVLEANPVARRLGWPFAVATLLIALIPYYNTALGVLALVPSLLVASRNFGSIWMMRGLGEERMLALQVEVAQRRPFPEAMMFVMAESAFLALAAGVLMVFSGGSRRWASLYALGMLLWAFALMVHRTAHLRRIYRLARSTSQSLTGVRAAA
jgi:hypothetical protein